MNIAVVDAGGNLVAHVRMDGAWLGSIDISINKSIYFSRIRYRNKGLGPTFAIRRPVLWHSRI